MKIFIVLGVVLAVAKAELSTEFKEKLIAKVQEVGASCAEKEQASGDDIGELLAQKPPTRKEGKCLIACFNEAFDAQGKDGKFSKEGIVKALEPFKKEDEDIYKKLLDANMDCLPEVKSSDRCDAAAEMAHCFQEKAKAAGLDPSMVI